MPPPESPNPPARRNPDSPRRARDLIRAEIRGGGYADGRLPSEEILMRQLHASRAVIRGALALLRAEGLIDRIQGIGTVVVLDLETMTLEESQGLSRPAPTGPWAGPVHPRLISQCEVELPPPITRQLGVPPRAPGIRIDYIALFDSRPLAVVTNYMRMPEAARLATARFSTDYYRYLADAGLRTDETTYLMEAAVADETDAELLEVPVGSAVMVAEQALLNERGEAFNYAYVRGRADRSAILSRVRRPPEV
jgi:GntR family transcriptional regulator